MRYNTEKFTNIRGNLGIEVETYDSVKGIMTHLQIFTDSPLHIELYLNESDVEILIKALQERNGYHV